MKGMDYKLTPEDEVIVASTLGVGEDDIIEIFGVARNCSPTKFGTAPVLMVTLFLPVSRVVDHIRDRLAGGPGGRSTP